MPLRRLKKNMVHRSRLTFDELDRELVGGEGLEVVQHAVEVGGVEAARARAARRRPAHHVAPPVRRRLRGTSHDTSIQILDSRNNPMGVCRLPPNDYRPSVRCELYIQLFRYYFAFCLLPTKLLPNLLSTF